MNIHYDSEYSDEERRRALYAGDLFVYSPTTEAVQLCGLAELMLADAFLPHDPLTIDQHLNKEECERILSKLKPAFTHHKAMSWVLPDLVAGFKGNLESTYFDVPRLRTAYPATYLTTGIAHAFQPHRDTWYAAPLCQINWWMPVSKIVPENCMEFYPNYFDRPILNNSEVYNLADWRPSGAADAARLIKADPSKQPGPLDKPKGAPLRVVCRPGSLLLFSAAHLHATVPNTSGIARYSTDFRTFNMDDLMLHHGAPNVDNRCQGSTISEFRRCSDLAHANKN